MEVGLLIFITCVAGLAFGLLYFRFKEAFQSSSVSRESHVKASQITSSSETIPRPSQIAAEAPSQAKDAPPAIAPSAPSDEEAWTAEEILRQLATIKKLNKDGTTMYLSKERMAALVGLRAEEARAIINEARGEPPPDGLKVRDSSGERLIPRQV